MVCLNTKPIKGQSQIEQELASIGKKSNQFDINLSCCYCSNMKAELLIKERLSQTENSFVELVLWRLPVSVASSSHVFKYQLAFIVDGVCVLHYDNEAGKGDHKHLGSVETAYAFDSPRQLLADFWNDVELWRTQNE